MTLPGAVLLAMLCFVQPKAVRAQTSLPVSLPASLTFRQFVFAAAHDTLRLALPDSFIISRSDTLRCGPTQFRRGRDYDLSYGTARLLWFGGDSYCDSLILTYRILPVQLPTKLALLELQPASPESAAVNPARAAIQPTRASYTVRTPGANLAMRGNITRGLSLGTDQALKVDSGLRLQVDGKLAEGVEVLAALSDQNTPIQPEGNTQTLSEIDKVSIELRSGSFNAMLGDFEIQYGGSEFARYSRKLQGARLELGARPAAGAAPAASAFSGLGLTISGATSRGQFITNEFLGTEGNQGPYQLKGERGQIDIIVLAGTERVWIDGESMVRGENNDYVIEYGNGQITFTRKRLITAEARITVDFQYSDESFRRSLYSAQGRASAWQRKIDFQTTILREGDDENNPLSFTLSDADRAILAAAGDHLAFRDGARLALPPERGDYFRQDSIWVYAGKDSGDYDVTFSDVGEGNGDYNYVSFGHYQFIGRQNGRYLPVILLTPAQRHNVWDNRLALQPWRGVQLINELAISRLDLNLYSSLDDRDNTGRAWLTSLVIEERPLRLGGFSTGRIAGQMRYRNKNSEYRDIDRSDVVEFNRRWNLSSAQISAEEILESALTYAPLAGWRFFGNVGNLQRGAQEKSNRWEAGTSLSKARWPELKYQIENIDRRESAASPASAPASSWLRQRGTLGWALGNFKPLAGYEAEDRKDESADTTAGFRFESMTAGLGWQTNRYLSLATSFNKRDDDTRLKTGLFPKSTAWSQNYTFNLSQWKTLVLGINYTHRDRDFKDAGTSDTRADLADVQLQFAPFRRALAADGFYQITNTQASKQERVFIQVPSGEGNYRFDPDLNEYIPDPVFGDYILRVLNTEEFIPIAEVRLRGKLRLQFQQFFPATKVGVEKPPPAAAWWQRTLSMLSTETFVRVEEKTQERDVWEIYRLNLSKFQNDSTTLYGLQSLQQDIYLWENRRDRSVRYRLTALRELNNQFLEGSARRNQMQHELRLILALSPRLTSQSEWRASDENLIYGIPGRTDRKLRLRQADFEFSYRPRPILEVANAAGLIYDRDLNAAPSQQTLTVYGFSWRPRVTYSWRSKGRWRVEAEWIQISADPSGQIIPYEMAKGYREGRTFRWNAAFEYRLAGNINVSLSYLGRREPDFPRTQHLGKMEMRLFF
ncbi:MAG: hypothetical protein ACREOO_32550 [bacterium]